MVRDVVSCDIQTTVILANYAAGIVVGKIGTETVSKQELLNSIFDK